MYFRVKLNCDGASGDRLHLTIRAQGPKALVTLGDEVSVLDQSAMATLEEALRAAKDLPIQVDSEWGVLDGTQVRVDVRWSDGMTESWICESGPYDSPRIKCAGKAIVSAAIMVLQGAKCRTSLDKLMQTFDEPLRDES